MNVVLKIENLWKEYRLGVFGQGMLFRDVQSWLARARGKEDPNSPVDTVGGANGKKDRIWALRDVSLDVRQGEVLGIIGRNGAGKSTLLKIVTKVTAPTRGTVKIRGRVASLLEVGTGFHPELTGRENVYLNGAILGMTVKEIKRKFDEIVDFSGVEQYIDTPVKRYSSGMHVRLAFAVAAHLESEILLVDEVLAVGDAEFQKKCFGKMEEVSGSGRTVLFVSHNLNAVEEMSNAAILLESGRVVQTCNNIRTVIMTYLGSGELSRSIGEWKNSGNELDTAEFKPLRFCITDDHGRVSPMPVRNDDLTWMAIDIELKRKDPAFNIGYALFTSAGQLLYWSLSTDDPEMSLTEPTQPGRYTYRSRIPQRLLNEGSYRLELMASLHFRQWLVEPGRNAPAITLQIQGGLSDSSFWASARPGELAPALQWTVTDMPSNDAIEPI
jgi:lipopolysaccharide transport system ATP-binding protein